MISKFFFNFLKRLAFRLRQNMQEIGKAQCADQRVYPKRSVTSKGSVEQWERICQCCTAHPKGEGACAHGNRTHAAWEQLGNQHPCNRTESHGVTCDGKHHERNHEGSLYLEIIARSEHEIYQRQSARAYQHELAAAKTLNRIYSHERENDVGNTSYDDVEQNVAQRIAGRLEYLLCVIEYHIRATPLPWPSASPWRAIADSPE